MQVLALHPIVTHIHLGGDEVYTLGRSAASDDLMRKKGFDKSGLYLHHMVPVLQFVKNNFKVKPIIWDDMLRKITLGDLQVSEICCIKCNIFVKFKKYTSMISRV